MESRFQIISKAIREQLDKGYEKFAVYPYGEQGCLTRQIFEQQFAIYDCVLIDDNIARYNLQVHNTNIMFELDTEYCLMFVCENEKIRKQLLRTIEEKLCNAQFIDVFCKMGGNGSNTICGKYSYGPLCDHPLVARVGAFCSFAYGVNVLPNHPTQYISTHDFVFHGNANGNNITPYDKFVNESWYFEGIEPQGLVDLRRITIGNDVWLGSNVLITNNSNIGNGVIAGAGTIITKDVPDYAIVVGSPARIIRYRYSDKQIKEINRICWWDWEDNVIRERYMDFFIDIDEFIEKYR